MRKQSILPLACLLQQTCGKVLVYGAICMMLTTKAYTQQSKEVFDSLSQTNILVGELSLEKLSQQKDYAWTSKRAVKHLIKEWKQNGIADTSLRFVVFLGTWCGDSKAIIPDLIALIHTGHLLKSQCVFYGVTREKQTLDSLATQYQIKRVPTMVIMRAGSEVYRIVEYGINGNWQNELLAYLYR